MIKSLIPSNINSIEMDAKIRPIILEITRFLVLPKYLKNTFEDRRRKYERIIVINMATMTIN